VQFHAVVSPCARWMHHRCRERDVGRRLMALHFRKRGEIWHWRGSVRIGAEPSLVLESSTGYAAKSDAEAVVSAEVSSVLRATHEEDAWRAAHVGARDRHPVILTFAKS
jgi:hypothetical protein